MFHGLLAVGLVLGVVLLFRPALFQGLSDKGVDNILLLVGEGVEHLFHCFAVILRAFLLIIRGLFLVFTVIILTVLRMGKTNAFASANDDLLLRTLAVGKVYKVDKCAGVGAGHDQTDLADHPVNYIPVLLFKLIGIDGERLHIAMLNQQLGRLAALRVVEGTIGVHAVLPVFQQGMAQNIERVVVLMVPDQRDGGAVAVGKGVLSDNPAVTADQIISGCPAAAITLRFLHFDLSPPLVSVSLCQREPEGFPWPR